MPDNQVTLVGNITRIEHRVTPTGTPNVQLGLAVNKRWQDNQTKEWKEETSFFNVIIWRDYADNVANSLTKGDRVVVVGQLKHRTWETPEGDKRSTVEIVADEVAPSLRWATIDGLNKTHGTGSGQGNKPQFETEEETMF